MHVKTPAIFFLIVSFALLQALPAGPNGIFSFFGISPVRAQGVPDTSIVPNGGTTWWNAGIPGGIPEDDENPGDNPNGVGSATVHTTLSPSGGDDFNAIQSALNAAGSAASKTSRKIVKLNAGTFNLSSDISIPSYVILRGTVGANNEPQSILNQTGTNGGLVSMWGGSGSWGTVRNLVGVHQKGATQITVDDASQFNIGDIITIDQVQDGTNSGPSNGIAQYNVPNTGNWQWNLSSLWYQRQPYSAGNGVGFLFPDSNAWRLTAQRTEVLAKNGNTLTIYDPATGRGTPLHLMYYNNPQVYRAGGTGDVTRYAGLENVKLWPRGTNGQRVVAIGQAAFSWVNNIEIDGTKNSWAGRHLELYAQTYKCEVRGSYFHGSSNYNQGGNAYGLDYQGSSNLIIDNIVRQLNKPIVAENSGGGNVIAYNYVDEAVIGSLTGDWQEAAISTHASFSHSELFEGNYTPNLGSDATHGNNGWITIFRNWATGQNSSGYATAYRRAIFSDGWNREMYSIGNVLWKPGSNVQNLFTASTQPSEAGNTNGIGYSGITQTAVYLIGSNAWVTGTGSKPGADNMDNGQSYSLFQRHLDYDYYSHSQYDNPNNLVKTLPDSLFLTHKPAFFGNYEWPWTNPGGATDAERIKILPAKARFDAGTPFALAPGVEDPDVTPPTDPTNPAASSNTQNSILLSWTASTDLSTGSGQVTGVSGYEIERCQGTSCSNFTYIATDSASPFTDTGLAPSTSYSYRIRAYDGAGNYSDYSPTASATTLAPDTENPTTPTNLSATTQSSSQIDLTWTQSTDNVGVDHYGIERCQGSNCSTFTQIATSTTNSYSNTGLSSETLYRYRVRAYDAANNASNYSNESEATTDQAPPSPTFVGEYETTWNSSTSPKTTTTFSVQTGDILVAYAVNENSSSTITTPPTGSLQGTWTLQQTISQTDYTYVRLWTLQVSNNQSDVNVSFTNGGGNFGGDVLHFRNASNVGTTNQATGSSGNPTLTLSNVQENSSIVMINGDWSAVQGSRTYTTTDANSFTETSYYADGSSYGIEGGYYQNAGTQGNKTIGITSPTGMKWALAAVEIQGSPSGTGGDTTPPTITETTAIPTYTKNQTPDYTFTTDEAGTISYSGDCSSATTTATVGANTITFDTLQRGSHSNCTLTVTDSSNNQSTPLTISPFTVTYQSDANEDGIVNIFDYNLMIGNFGTTSDCGNPSDTDNDCDVDIFDYSILVGDFGGSV